MPSAQKAEQFEAIDWDAPVDVQAHIDACAEKFKIRGMFPAALVKRVKKKTGNVIGSSGGYIDFKLYPLREHIALLGEATEHLFPGLPQRRALREIAGMGMPTLRSSMVGRVLHNLSGGTTRAGLELVTKAYSMARDHGSARVGEHGAHYAVVELRDIFDFADSVHVGIFETGLIEWGNNGHIEVRRLGIGDVDLKLRIDEKA